MFARHLAVVLAALVVLGGSVAVGLGGRVDQAAEVRLAGVRLDPGPGDLAIAYDIGDVDQFVVDASAEAAELAGGSSATRRGGSIGLRRITRGASIVHAPPSGYLIPMVFMAVPTDAARAAYGIEIAQVMAAGDIVLNQLTADLTGALAGDRLELRTTSGGTVSVRVGMLAEYDALGGTELVFDTTVADRLGFADATSTLMWGFDRDRLDSALVEVGLEGRRDTEVARSWDPPDPDSTLSTARTKEALGEPWYRVNTDGTISMHPEWIATNLTDGRVLLDPTIRIWARCHVEIVDDLSAALAEVAAAGLTAAIDVANANAYGGCFVPRYSRTSGYLSRHAYGMALDVNTVTDCFGCRPQMDCEVVRIFRRHNFAWGGNFRKPDGMHFEWVGERRDQLPYPSKYCPNVVAPLTERELPSLGREVLAHGPTDHDQHEPHHHDHGATP